MMMCMSSIIAQTPNVIGRVKADKSSIDKKDYNVSEVLKNNRTFNPCYRDGDNAVVNTTLLTEDFSNFTAGSETEPDAVRLDDPETNEIDDTYFNTPGWSGLEVYQAGGCAFIDFSEDYGETGMIITPLLNTYGSITIKCRMKSTNSEGDYVGYNIASEDFEALDSNIGYLLDDQWTEISWFTSYGGENTHIYLFAYEHGVYIDDIEIIHHYMPTPTILPETNVTENSFTANWEAIEDADDYNFFLYTEHTAATDETYNLYDFNFNDIVSDGTEDNPEEPEEVGTIYNAWYVYLHMYFNGGIGMSGSQSEYGMYPYMTSPEIDLSSDDGKVTLSMKMKGLSGENVDIYLYSAPEGYYDVVDLEEISLPNNEWNEYTIELEGGYENSIIEIMYYGLTSLLIDDLKVSQNLRAGEIKSTLVQETLTSEPNIDIIIKEDYQNDKTYYQLYGIKYMYTYDPFYDEYYMAGGITSDFTEPRYSPTNETGIIDMNALSPAYVYFNNGILNVFNPDNEMVSVYNINGVCVYSKVTNGVVEHNLPKGIYVVKIGNKTIKAVNN